MTMAAAMMKTNVPQRIGHGGNRNVDFCQLELRRTLLILLLIAGTALDQIPSYSFAEPLTAANGQQQQRHAEQAASKQQQQEFEDAAEKRAGGRAFLPSSSLAAMDQLQGMKRGGARMFAPFVGNGGRIMPEKKAGARAFASSQQQQQQMPFFDGGMAAKRAGARPFFGTGAGFYGGGAGFDGTWKRGGGRFFYRAFGDEPNAGMFGSGWGVKRAGGRHFTIKRAGGRAFFGGMDSLFDPSNYWAPRRYAPISNFPRRSLQLSPLGVTGGPSFVDDDEAENNVSPQRHMPSSPFFYAANGKRGGGRAFGDDADDEDSMMTAADMWEKRGGGRMFGGGDGGDFANY